MDQPQSAGRHGRPANSEPRPPAHGLRNAFQVAVRTERETLTAFDSAFANSECFQAMHPARCPRLWRKDPQFPGAVRETRRRVSAITPNQETADTIAPSRQPGGEKRKVTLCSPGVSGTARNETSAGKRFVG